MFRIRPLVACLTVFMSSGVVLGLQDDPEHAVMIGKIIDEGKNRSQVMDHLRHLTEEIGPRLTASSRVYQANEWTRDKFASWGLANAHMWQWGTFPVGFDRGPCIGRMLEPVERDFEFTASAWTAGTPGPVKGPVYKEPVSEEALNALIAELEAEDKTIKGAWILQKPTSRGVRDTPDGMPERLREMGIAGMIQPRRGELVHTGGRGWRDLTNDNLPTEVTVRVRRSDYDAMNSRLSDGEEVIVEFDLQHTFMAGPVATYNTIAEIPGTTHADEVVIISAHLDSWDGPGSQGCVDNGTGSSVTLEAARILAAVGAKPKRTIRFILWTGEEQGLLGSKAYVESLSEEELSRISAVFVDDGGTNYQGGLTCVKEMVDMLRWATAPVGYAFPELPMVIDLADEMPRGGASDHASFNRAGVPGFFWKETGRADYRYAWHTQNDTYDQGIPEYLIQSATCSAVTAFNLANAETMLPRPMAEDEEATAAAGGSDGN